MFKSPKTTWAVLIAAVMAGRCAREETGREVKVQADPRIELLAAVQVLGDYGKKTGLVTRFDLAYKREVKEYFAPFKDHAAVRKMEHLAQGGFSYDAPPAMMLYLGKPPKLKQETGFPRYLVERARGQHNLEEFRDYLRDFSEQSRFMDFFASHRAFYEQLTREAAGLVQGRDYIQTLENYFGVRQHSYTIILAPLFHPGGFAHLRERKGGQRDVFNICGPQAALGDRPVFGDEEGFKFLAWHEFGHSFVNPVTAEYRTQVAAYDTLYQPLAGRMQALAYGSWETCLNEHLVRAVTGRLLLAERGRPAVEQMLEMERNRGFLYIEPLFNQLEHYENQRVKYPEYRDFFPELVTVLEEVASGAIRIDPPSADFNGSINSVSMDAKNLVVIVSTGEKDRAAGEKLADYVRTVHQRFWAQAPLLTDQEALKQDLKDKSIICYGTLTGHRWLARYLTEPPVRIEKGRITADRVYRGTNLRFITAWPNPLNPEKGLLVYTAQRCRDITAVNSVFHGPTDWVVARGTKVLGEGFYEKGQGKWEFKKKNKK